MYTTIPRDTIGIARLVGGATNIVANVYDSTVFFNDSAYFSINTSEGRNFDMIKTQDGTAIDSFLVLYGDHRSGFADASYPAFKDHVYIFHHDYLDPARIYFQRCASFGKGIHQEVLELHDKSEEMVAEYGPDGYVYYINDYVPGDSIAYWWNKDATCVSSTDTIVFRVGGGFFPYTYTWDMDSIVYQEGEQLTGYSGTNLNSGGNGKASHMALKRINIRNRETYGTNQIANLGSELFNQLRAKARIDTLLLDNLTIGETMVKTTYLYEVEARDLTGRCPVNQAALVRIGKITSDGRTGTAHAGDYYIDSINFLHHRNPYAAYHAYKDDLSTTVGHYEEFPTIIQPDPEVTASPATDPIAPDGGVHSDSQTPNYSSSPYDGAGYVPPNHIHSHYTDDQRTWINVNTGEIRKQPNNPEGGSVTTETWHMMADFNYYRLTAPGVDSSSFHDHVPLYTMENLVATTKPYGATTEERMAQVFINHHGDWLFPYIRPWDIETPETLPTFNEISNVHPNIQDTLGYEIRQFDTTWTTTDPPAIASIKITRYRMDKHIETDDVDFYKKELTQTGSTRQLGQAQIGKR